MRKLLYIALAAGLATSASAQTTNDDGPSQPVTNQAEVEATTGPAEYFTGTSHVRRLSSATQPGQAGTALVTFEPGARSNWHMHPAGQTLFVTDGCGLTQVEGGPVQRICAGDVVYAAPGIKHWHGANGTAAMSHLAITESVNGTAVDWLEPVTDEQYPG